MHSNIREFQQLDNFDINFTSQIIYLISINKIIHKNQKIRQLNISTTFLNDEVNSIYENKNYNIKRKNKNK